MRPLSWLAIVAGFALALPMAAADIAPPPQAPRGPHAAAPTLTRLGFQLQGARRARIALQLSAEVPVYEDLDGNTLVVELPGVAFSASGDWGTVDTHGYDTSVAAIAFARGTRGGSSVVVRVTFQGRAGARRGAARIERGQDGFRYLVIDTGADGAVPVHRGGLEVEPGEPEATTGGRHVADVDTAPPPPHDERADLPGVVSFAPPADAPPSGPDWRTGPRWNLAASTGYNSPAGFLGLEVDFRVQHYISLGVAGGVGGWGYRVSPTVKLDLLPGRRTQVFFEAAVAVNLGGAGTVTSNGMVTDVDMGVVPTADVAVGVRVHKFGPLWTGFRLGVAVALATERFTTTGTPDQTTRDLIDALYPGSPSILVAWMAGASF